MMAIHFVQKNHILLIGYLVSLLNADMAYIYYKTNHLFSDEGGRFNFIKLFVRVVSTPNMVLSTKFQIADISIEANSCSDAIKARHRQK